VTNPDLEIVPLASEDTASEDTAGEDTTTPVAQRRRRRGLWALAATVAVLVALVFPVRTAFAHAEVDRLEHEWAELVALDQSRASLANRLVSEGVATDEEAVRRAAIALDEEEVGRITALRRSLPGNRLDGGASALRRAIVQAFDQEVLGLRGSIAVLEEGGTIVPAQLDGSTVDFSAVQSRIDAERQRFGEDLHDQHPSTARLHAADATLAEFAHFADSPLGARLLVTTKSGMHVLDIDRSYDNPVALGSDTHVSVVSGSVYALSGDRVFRLPGDLRGSGQDFGPGVALAPGPEGELWVATADGTLRLATSGGRTVWGPEPVSYGLLGSVDEGVVAVDPSVAGFAVIDPQLGGVVRTIETRYPPANAALLGASGDTVAYTGTNDTAVHVVTVSSGSSRDFPILSPFAHQSGIGALSPDGQLLATYEVSAAGSATAVVINLVTGDVTDLTNVSNSHPDLSLAWTADSSRLFFTVSESGATLATWGVGDSSATVLRWRGATAAGIVTVLP
jgi:hypothetical protein